MNRETIANESKDQWVEISREGAGVSLRLKELWDYRELLYFLAWRDIKIRYKQTALGAAWAVLQPFFTMLVFSLFFGRLAKIPSDGIPYPLFAFAALIPWIYFSQSLLQASNSLVGNANLIRRVYFPRVLIPAANVVSGTVDFAVSFLVLLGMMAFYGTPITWKILLVPVFLLFAMMTALGTGLWLSAVNVRFRDVRYTVPFLVQIWMFATPIAYPSSLLNESWRTWYGLNPMSGIIEGFRWILLGSAAPSGMLAVSLSVSICVLVTGLIYFRKMEKHFADIV